MSEIKWAPYVERMHKIFAPLNMKEIDELEGRDLRPVKNFKTPMGHGWFKAYTADKIDKIGFGDFFFMNCARYSGAIVWPSDDYDLPIYMSDWDEEAKKIHTLVDIVPTVDVLVDEEYRKKYMNPLTPLWNKYATLPGLTPELSDWGRAMCSICYTCAIVPTEPNDVSARFQALEPHLEYLRAWVDFWKKAEPIKDEKKKKEIKTRKAAISGNYRKYFTPLLAGVRKAMGGANADLMVIIYF